MDLADILIADLVITVMRIALTTLMTFATAVSLLWITRRCW